MAPLKFLKNLGSLMKQGQDLTATGAGAAGAGAVPPSAFGKAPPGYKFNPSGLLVPESTGSSTKPKPKPKNFAEMLDQISDFVMDAFERGLLKKCERLSWLSFRSSLAFGGTVASGSAILLTAEELWSGSLFRRFMTPDAADATASNNFLCRNCNGQQPELNYLQMQLVADSFRTTIMEQFHAGIADANKNGIAFEFAFGLAQLHRQKLQSTPMTASQAAEVQKVFLNVLFAEVVKSQKKPAAQ